MHATAAVPNFRSDAPPLGVTVAVTLVANCPTCGDAFTAENLSTLSPEGALTCGPCIGQPRRV